MKYLGLLVVALVGLVVVLGAKEPGASAGPEPELLGEEAPTVPGELIVHYKDEISPVWNARFVAAPGAGLKRMSATGRYATYAVPAGLEEEYAERLLRTRRWSWWSEI
jgi:hypothetical protein